MKDTSNLKKGDIVLVKRAKGYEIVKFHSAEEESDFFTYFVDWGEGNESNSPELKGFIVKKLTLEEVEEFVGEEQL